MTVLQAMRAPLGVLSVWSIAGAAWSQTNPETAEANAAREATARAETTSLTSDQLEVLFGLGALLALMLVIGTALILNLQRQTRELANDHSELRDRYAALPFGVPEGTVRGLVSILIIVMGIAVLVVQNPLGIESTEAVAGFVSAVIAFYFVTREQAQTRGAMEHSSRALEESASALREANASFAIVAGKSDYAFKTMLNDAKKIGVSHMLIDNLVYAEVADALEDDPARFDPARAMGKGGDGLTGYNFQAKWLRPIVSDIVARARIKEPLVPHQRLIAITDDDAFKVAEAAIKGDAAALIAAIVKKIEKCLTDANITVTMP